MQAQENNLKVFDTADALCTAVAEFIIDQAGQAVKARGRFSIALSGGHTPEKLYALLASPAYRDRMPWAETSVWWGDERCVPADDPQSNAHMAKTTLLDKVNIPSANVHPVHTELAPADAAKEYEKELNDFFGTNQARFDLILLGLGDNGHTASLFPGTPVLDEKAPGVREVYLSDQKMYRITMTAPLINHAACIAFLVTGKEKATVLKTILTGAYDPAVYPAQLIKPIDGDLYWYADKDAAAIVGRLTSDK